MYGVFESLFIPAGCFGTDWPMMALFCPSLVCPQCEEVTHLLLNYIQLHRLQRPIPNIVQACTMCVAVCLGSCLGTRCASRRLRRTAPGN